MRNEDEAIFKVQVKDSQEFYFILFAFLFFFDLRFSAELWFIDFLSHSLSLFSFAVYIFLVKDFFSWKFSLFVVQFPQNWVESEQKKCK